MRARELAVAAFFLLSAVNAFSQKGGAVQSCRGLHAGIAAQFNPYTQQPSIQIGFFLLNDSDTPIEKHADSWRLLVDGAELEDFAFFSGPIGPAEFDPVLQPGGHWERGVALPIAVYFTKGEHRVQWKGVGFESSTITVKVN